MAVSQNDPVPKYLAITLFEIILFGVFFAGYDAGLTQDWWKGLLILIMFPVLNRFFGDDQKPSTFKQLTASLDDFFDHTVKLGVIILFMAATALVFYSGYFAGLANLWWICFWVLIAIPIILKYYSG